MSIFIDFFNHFQYNFYLFTNEIELFNYFLSPWNQFCQDDSDSDDEFGYKKLIKRHFDHNIKPNLALD